VKATKMAINIHDLLSLLMVNSQAFPRVFSSCGPGFDASPLLQIGPLQPLPEIFWSRRGDGTPTDSIAQRKILSRGLRLNILAVSDFHFMGAAEG